MPFPVLPLPCGYSFLHRIIIVWCPLGSFLRAWAWGCFGGGASRPSLPRSVVSRGSVVWVLVRVSGRAALARVPSRPRRLRRLGLSLLARAAVGRSCAFPVSCRRGARGSAVLPAAWVAAAAVLPAAVVAVAAVLPAAVVAVAAVLPASALN